MKPDIYIREAVLEEDALIAQHFYQMWLDNDVPANLIEAGWLNITLQFIDRARRELCYQAFVAEVENRVVGSVSCQLFTGLYPHILTTEYRNYGYIWGVYVESAYRGRGIGKQLTSKAVNYLRSIGCTKAILHASPSGQPVYTSLGFASSNEMKLDLL
ncbi:MAG TPA: GNAT family N-acetyltransferase [Leptolyngbyaceae cyanobacterium]